MHAVRLAFLSITNSPFYQHGFHFVLLPIPYSPNPLTPLPRIPRVERVPSAHAARLHAQEISPGVVRPQVGHALRLALPWIPHHDGRQHVAFEPVPRLVALGEHGDGLLWRRGVDAVGFGGKGERFVRGGSGRGGGFGFVEEGGGFEPFDGGRGYVLCCDCGELAFSVFSYVMNSRDAS